VGTRVNSLSTVWDTRVIPLRTVNPGVIPLRTVNPGLNLTLGYNSGLNLTLRYTLRCNTPKVNPEVYPEV